MTLSVFGKICLANGQVADRLNGGYTAKNFFNLNGSVAKLGIKNGDVIIEYDSIMEKAVEGYKDKAVVWLYHISRDFINNFILTQELRSDKCLIFLPEYFQRSDGTKNPFLWNILDGISTTIDEVKFMYFLAENPKFRDGVNDFHIALLDTSNSPAHFYRVVDTLGQFVIKKDGRLENSEWIDFKTKIGLDGTEKAELEALTKVGTEYRHGNRTIPVNDYVSYLRIAKVIIIKTYEYTLREQNRAFFSR